MSIQPCIDHYNELFDREFADSTRDILSEAIEAHDLLYKAPSPTRVLRPCMVAASTYAAVSNAVSAMGEAIALVADRLADDPQLRRALCLPDYLEPLIAADHHRGRHSTIARFDGFLSPEGVFSAIEYNSEPHGIHRGFELNTAFAAMPISQAFARRYRFSWPQVLDLAHDALLREHRDTGGRSTPAIAVLGVGHDLGVRPDMRWLSYVAARGCRVIPATTDELDYTNSRLHVNGVSVDLVALLDWTDVIVHPERVGPLLTALKDGTVRVVNGFSRGMLSSYKSLFEVMSDQERYAVLPARLAAVVQRHIPWTRVLRDRKTIYRGREIDLLEHVSEHRENFVLKPSGGSEGAGVLLGWTATSGQWERALRRPGGHVVQERVPSGTALYPVDTGSAVDWRELRTDCAPYVWNGTRARGWLARSTSGDLLNVATGSMNTPVWVVDDADLD